MPQSLQNKFNTIHQFLSQNPELAPKFRGNRQPVFGTNGYTQKLFQNFINGRQPKAPEAPHTIPDPMVSIILHHYFDIAENQLERIKREHLLSMGAENLVGGLLERYIANIAESSGWVWCSGETIKAIDFIKPLDDTYTKWRLLQVKNRDNSENSSSSAIRNGTTIEKWFRTFSRRQATNWDNFPDRSLSPLLSESGFIAFTNSYLTQIKNQ